MINYDFHDLSKRTDEEIEQQITEGFRFGDYDTIQHDMFLISREAPTPDEKEIIESVPYMDGVYDFSSLSGERYFENREITYKVMLFNQNYTMRKDTENDIKRQLMPLGIQPLYDTHDTGFHWMGKVKSIVVEDDSKLRFLSATITFDCYPFAITNHVEGSDIWDEVYFPHWVFQNKKYIVNGSQQVKLFNIGSKSVECTVISSDNVVLYTNNSSVNLNSETNVQVVLSRGINTFTLNGNGTVEFNFYREEMY